VTPGRIEPDSWRIWLDKGMQFTQSAVLQL
jgi:hypothetical protein